MAKSSHSKRNARRKGSKTGRNRRSGKPKAAAVTTLRIIGGSMGGRKLKYGGDPQTRPMRDAVRESLFNLVGPSIVGTFAIDLFTGTGAVAAEAISRGAVGGVAFELSAAMAHEARQNLAHLEIESQVRLVQGDAFALATDEVERLTADSERPWSVFCCPPYALFEERYDDLKRIIEWVQQHAPPESVMAVESRTDWDASLLPDDWRVRCYGINQLAIWRS